MKSGPASPPLSPQEREQGLIFDPQFNEQGLIPALAVDDASGQILMMAWMNREALRLTRQTAEAHYWSRSRQQIWRKGATSGQIQRIVSISVDCDQDCLLLRVKPQGDGGACHLGETSCFHRQLVMPLSEDNMMLRKVTSHAQSKS